MKIIRQENWHYTLFENDDGSYVFDFLLPSPKAACVSYGVKVVLPRYEKLLIKIFPSRVDYLVDILIKKINQVNQEVSPRLSGHFKQKMNTKFFEYDVVKSVRCIGEEVPGGTSGTVMMVFASIQPKYEVEFVNNAGESLAVLTVNEDDLELVKRAD